MTNGILAACALAVVCQSGLGQPILYVDDDSSGPIQDGGSWATAYATIYDALEDAAIHNSSDPAPVDPVTEIRVAGGVYLPGIIQTDVLELVPDVNLLGGFRGLAPGGSANERDLAAFESLITTDFAGNDNPDLANLEDLLFNRYENSYGLIVAEGELFSNTRIDGFAIEGGFVWSGDGNAGQSPAQPMIDLRFDGFSSPSARPRFSRINFRNIACERGIFQSKPSLVQNSNTLLGTVEPLILIDCVFENIYAIANVGESVAKFGDASQGCGTGFCCEDEPAFVNGFSPPLGKVAGVVTMQNCKIENVRGHENPGSCVDPFFGPWWESEGDLALLRSGGLFMDNCLVTNVAGFFLSYTAGNVSNDFRLVLTRRFEFRNCTFDGLTSSSGTSEEWPDEFYPTSGGTTSDARDALVANCIFTNYDAFRFSDIGVTVQNSYLENDTWGGDGSGNLTNGTIGYHDALNGDYRLATGSPAIDAGDDAFASYVVLDPEQDGLPTVDMPVDLGGRERMAGTGVDIGAFEYHDSCNNGLADWELVGQSGFEDYNSNGLPDSCEPDVDGNGVPDSVDIDESGKYSQYPNQGGRADLNQNGIPDDTLETAFAGGESDCDENGIPDDLDILFGNWGDADLDGLPDVPPQAGEPAPCDTDCDGNAVADSAECKIDVVFLLDSSGSMTDRWRELDSLLDATEFVLLDRNATSRTTRYYLAENPNTTSKEYPPIFGATPLKDTANGINPSIPGPMACGTELNSESWGEGVALVADDRSVHFWETASARVIVVLADEGACNGDGVELQPASPNILVGGPGGTPWIIDQDDTDSVTNAITVANETENGVFVVTAMMETSNDVTLQYAQDMADGTGGTMVPLSNYQSRGGMVKASSDLASAILNLDFQCVECEEPDCVADFNNDGVADNGDIGDFVAAFLAGDSAADLNDDGVLDNGDLQLFVLIFLQGCV